MDWIHAHKAVLGTVFGGLAAVAQVLGYHEVALGIGAVSSFLIGGGITESDAAQKENQRWAGRQ